MNAALGIFLSLFSVLVPQKMWYAPSQPLKVTIQSDKSVTLVLTDFQGKTIDAKASADLASGASVDVKTIFPTIGNPGTFVLYAVAKGSSAAGLAPKDFLGTPLVIEVLHDDRKGAAPGPMVTHVEPLRYALMATDAGNMTMIFYYDVAPHTVDSFLELSEQGYYDGLNFHRIVPGFVIQGGDPVGTGTGGPGYHLDSEFNDRPHTTGTLSMARNGDPAENAQEGVPPRPEYRNSAGSQFFICLNYDQTKQLDGSYTAFGKVTDGIDTTVPKIAGGALSDPRAGTPAKPVVIQSVKVMTVTADKNPYGPLMSASASGAPGTK